MFFRLPGYPYAYQVPCPWLIKIPALPETNWTISVWRPPSDLPILLVGNAHIFALPCNVYILEPEASEENSHSVMQMECSEEVYPKKHIRVICEALKVSWLVTSFFLVVRDSLLYPFVLRPPCVLWPWPLVMVNAKMYWGMRTKNIDEVVLDVGYDHCGQLLIGLCSLSNSILMHQQPLRRCLVPLVSTSPLWFWVVYCWDVSIVGRRSHSFSRFPHVLLEVPRSPCQAV